MDYKYLTYTPRWVKTTAIIILLITSIFSFCVIVISWNEPNRLILIEPAMTMMQISLSALAILLMIIFSQIGATPERFNEECERFLSYFLPKRLEQIDFIWPDFNKIESGIGERVKNTFSSSLLVPESITKIKIQKPKNVPFALYKITAYETEMTLFVQVNVKEIVVKYFIPVSESNIDLANKVSDLSFDGSERDRGYYVAKSDKNIAQFGNIRCLETQLSWSLDNDFLLSGSDKLFVANTISLVTRAFLMRCKEFYIDIKINEVNSNVMESYEKL